MRLPLLESLSTGYSRLLSAWASALCGRFFGRFGRGFGRFGRDNACSFDRSQVGIRDGAHGNGMVYLLGSARAAALRRRAYGGSRAALDGQGAGHANQRAGLVGDIDIARIGECRRSDDHAAERNLSDLVAQQTGQRPGEGLVDLDARTATLILQV